MANQLRAHTALGAERRDPDDRAQRAAEIPLIGIGGAAAVGVRLYRTRQGAENRAVALDDERCMGEGALARFWDEQPARGQKGASSTPQARMAPRPTR